jgi:preprotein translocase subunit SecD
MIERYLLLASCLALFLAAAPADAGAPLRFEVRLLSDEMQDGWSAAPDPFGGRQLYLSPDVALSNTDVASAWYDPVGEEHRVGLLLTEEGAVKLAKLTKRHIGERLALIVDGRILSAPVVAGEISGGRALIQGDLTEDEARAVVKGLDPREEPSGEQ